MRRVMLIALALVAALGITASTATTATTETGVTAKSITIGGTFPLSGPASLYATIPVAMKAYFSYINARRGPDGKRGVYGRQIVWNYKDDGYSPPKAVQLTRGLVEQDNVFAVVGSLGTEVNTRDPAVPELEEGPAHARLDRRDDVGRRLEAVPVDDRLAAGLPARGQDLRPGDRPQQPEREDRACIYQNDDYGKDYIAGLEAGLGAKASNIVGKEPFEVTAPSVARRSRS